MADYEITSGVTSTGIILNDKTMNVLSGGVASSTTANSKGVIDVLFGGFADKTTVNYGGTLFVSSGGSATGILENGGYVLYSNIKDGTFIPNKIDGLVLESASATIHSATSADNTTINSRGSLIIYSDGKADGITVNPGGAMYIYSGATATEILENGGYISYPTSANVTFVPNTLNGLVLENSATIHSATAANNTTLQAGGQLIIHNGGRAEATTANSGGRQTVSSGGTANNTTVNSNGNLTVYSGGTATRTTVNSDGNMAVYDYASANGVTVNSGGTLYIENASATDVVENGGYVSVTSGAKVKFKANVIGGMVLTKKGATLHSGTTANSATVNSSGSLFATSGGKASNTTVNSRGRLETDNGGTANNTTVNSDGAMTVSRGGKADGTTVNSGGNLYVSAGGKAAGVKVNNGRLAVASGGTAEKVDWTPCEGTIWVENGGTVKFVSKYSGVYLGSAGRLTSQTASMDGQTVGSGYEMNVMAGGTANGITVNEGGSVTVSSGGRADGVTLNGGSMWVSSGVTVKKALVSKGGLEVYGGGAAAYGTVVGGSDYPYGKVRVTSGGIANRTTVYEGTVYVNAGTAYAVTVKDRNGELVVSGSGGSADNVVVSGGYLLVAFDGVAKGVSLLDGADLEVSSGGAAINVEWTPCEGKIKNSSGGMVLFASSYYGVYYGSDGHLLSHSMDTDGKTVDSASEMFVYSDGIADKTMLESGSLHVRSGGAVSRTTVDSWGNLYISSGCVANRTTVNQGYVSAFSGCAVNNTTINSGGGLYLSGYASATTVGSGGSMMFFYGTADSIEVMAGGKLSFWVGGSASGILVASGGSAEINRGASVRDIEVYGSVLASSCDADGVTVYEGGMVSVRTDSYGLSNVTISSGGSLVDSSYFGKALDGVTVSNGGEITILKGGSAANVTVHTGGTMTVSQGALTGSMTFATGANVTLTESATVDFDISTMSSGEAARPLLNDMTVITGAPQYRLVVSQTQDFGIYTLAGGAAGFDGSVSVLNEKRQKSGYSLTVGETVDIFGAAHTLTLDGDTLTLVINSSSENDPADDGWNDYLYDKKTKTFNNRIGTSQWVDAGTKEILLDSAGTVRYADTHNFIGLSDDFGTLDPADFSGFSLTDAAKMSFILSATTSMKFTVWRVDRGTDKKGNTTYSVKALQSVTVKDGYADTTKKPLLLEAGSYYLSMELSNPKKAGEGYYSVMIDPGTEFYTKGNMYNDDWDNMKEEGAGRSANLVRLGMLGEDSRATLVRDEWVGFGDTVDYRQFTLVCDAQMSFRVDAGGPVKFTVWKLNEKTDKNGNTTCSLKSLQSTTIKNSLSQTKNLLLEAGDYYFSVESTDAKKGGGSDYSVSLNDCTFFTRADNSDDWTDMKTMGADGMVGDVGVINGTSEFVVEGGWIGFGDAVDYKKFTLKTDATVCFKVCAENAAKFTVWQLNGKTDKKGNTTYSLKALASVKVKEFVDADTKVLKLAAGDYYFSMESSNAKKGGSAFYDVIVNQEKSEFPGLLLMKIGKDECALTGPEDVNGWSGSDADSAPADILADAGYVTISGADLADMQMSASADPAASPVPVMPSGDIFDGLSGSGAAFADASASLTQDDGLSRQAAGLLA